MKQEQEWAQPSPVLRLYYPKRTIFGLIVVPTVLNCAPFGLGGPLVLPFGSPYCVGAEVGHETGARMGTTLPCFAFVLSETDDFWSHSGPNSAKLCPLWSGWCYAESTS
jgi:hypothetical protein